MKRHLVISEEMLEFDLRGSELLAYALIWGFSQDGGSDFHGSVEYVARWCKVSRQQASAILRSLTEKGFLAKVECPGHPAHYAAVDPCGSEDGGVSNNLTPGCKETLQGGVKKFDRGCQETLHPASSPLSPSPFPPAPPISSSPISPSPSPENTPSSDVEGVSTHTPARKGGMIIQYYGSPKSLYGEKVMLDPAEHARLVEKFGEGDAARLIEILDDYLVNHPRKRYESHYRAILSWCVPRLQEEKLTEQRLRNARDAGRRMGDPPAAQLRSERTTLEDVKRTMDRINAKYR